MMQSDSTKISQLTSPPSFWSRPGGPAEVLAIALPLIVSTAFWSIQMFVDRVFLMRYSTEAMAAAMPAGMVHWTLICLPMGIASYVNTFVAQYHGAGKPERIGLAVTQGMWIGLVSIPLLLLPIPLAPFIFKGAADSSIVEMEVAYFQSLAWGAGAAVLGAALSSFYTGRGKTGLVMWVQVAGTLVNIGLDYGLVFGRLGLPELGIAGAGYATSVANWFTAGLFALLIWRSGDWVKFGFPLNLQIDRSIMWRLLRFGAPGALPMMIEALAFSGVTIFITQIGKNEGAATGLAFSVNAVAFVPIIGLSVAVSTLVGQHLGEGRPEIAARATWNALWIALLYTLLFGLLYVFVPHLFLLAHETGTSQQDFEEVKSLTMVLLRFVALYCLFDAMQLVFVGALKGAGDTKFIFLATTIISLSAVVLGRFGQAYLGWGIFGWWWVLTGWLLTMGIAYLVRFWQGKWRTMRVIEQ